MKMIRIIYNKVLPSLFWILLLLAFDSPYMAMLTLFAAAFHEIGHIAVSTFVFNKKISIPKAVMYGLRIDTGACISYKEELLVALGGPGANILAFLLSLPFLYLCEYVYAFCIINLLTAISNLIPLRSYDGQRILSGIVSPFLSPYVSDAIIHFVSLTVASAGCFVSIFLIGRIGDGYWIFCIFFISLINEICIRSKNSFTNKKRE